jgi:hypothetical protein
MMLREITEWRQVYRGSQIYRQNNWCNVIDAVGRVARVSEDISQANI